MHLCHRGIHATKVGSFFVLLILWISCLVSLSSLILHGSWCIHYHSTWAHYLQPYRMAISRDNAEIVAKEIQISLNLFERAEHVLNICIVKHTRTFTFNLRITCTSARRNVHSPFLADLERKLESVVVYIHACRRCLIRRRPISPRMCWSINQSVIHSQSSVYWKKTCPSCRQGPEPQYCIVVYPGLRYLNAAELILGGPEHIDPVYKPIPV